jgi:hypothetical protein
MADTDVIFVARAERAEREDMSKKPGSVITAEQHARNAFKRVEVKQTIADREASPEFQENYERLRAERQAREQAAKKPE